MLFSLLHTPMPPSTRYRNATAIIQTKNNATDSTSETFSALHGSIRRICMLARTGPDCCGRPTCTRPGAVARPAPAARCVQARPCAAGPRGRAGQVGKFTGVGLADAGRRFVACGSLRGGSLRVGAVGGSGPTARGPPEMKRFRRASTPGEWPGAAAASMRLRAGGLPRRARGGCSAPRGPRARAATAAVTGSVTWPRPIALPMEPVSDSSGTEPLALPGPSPARGIARLVR